MGSKREVGLDPRGPLDYMGPDVALMTISQNDRAPTTTDTHYPLSHHWRIDSSAIAPAVEGDMWFLAKFEANGDADWQKIASGATPGGTVITISDASGIATPPDAGGDIQLYTAIGSGMTIATGPGANQITFALDGGIDVQNHTAPGTDPVVPVAGILTVQGTIVGEHSIPIQTNSLAAGTVNIEVQQSVAVAAADATRSGMCHFNSNHLSCAATGYVDVNQAQSSSATNAAISGISHYDINDFSVDANGFTALKNGAMVENLGVTYDSATGIFQVCGDSGSALSATNAAYVRIDDITTAATVTTGYPKRYKIVANQSFTDDTGASTIAGNSFQTAAVTWAYTMPFYLYAVANSNKVDATFAICRLPCLKKAPAVAKCARVGTVASDVQYGMFFLSTPTLADYAGQPCVCVGSFCMTKTTAAHDWTVIPLTFYDGIGQFKDSAWWQMPKVNNGCGNTVAGANSIFLDNTGTSAEIANPLLYKINLNNTIDIIISSAITKTGVGAVTALATMPLEILGAGGGIVSNGTLIYKAIAGNLQTAYVPQLAGNYMGFAYCEGSTTLLQNDTLNVNDLLETSFNFKIYTNLLNGGVF